MKRILLAVLTVLLIAAPFELSARQVVRHHRAAAQTANTNCTFGTVSPPAGTQCGTADLTPGGALANTDAVILCQIAGGCFGSANSISYKSVQLPGYIRSALSGTPPITLNSSTGAIGCANFSTSAAGCVPASSGGATAYLNATGGWSVPSGSGTGLSSVGLNVPASSLFTVTGSPLIANGAMTLNTTGTAGGIAYFSSGTQMQSTVAGTVGQVLLSGGSGAPTWGAAGGATTITLAPGLASTAGTYNTGTQTATNGSTISPQLMWEGHSGNYTVLATDSGKLFEVTALGVTFTLPAAGAAGSASYSFASGYGVGGGSYTVTSPSEIYGCGVTSAAPGSVTLSFDATFIPAAAGWKCSGSINTTLSQLSWGPGMNLQTSPIPMVGRRGVPAQVTGYLCMPGVVVGGTPALIDLYQCPEGASSIPPGGTGCTKINTAASCVAGTGAGGGVGVTQVMTPASATVVQNGYTVWAVGSGAGWTTANVASSSGVITLTTSP